MASHANSPPVPRFVCDDIGSDGSGGVGSSPNEVRRVRSKSHSSRMLFTRGSDRVEDDEDVEN